MRDCIICHKPTEGSVGAAGIKWSCICQPCKDAEDKALADRISYEAAELGERPFSDREFTFTNGFNLAIQKFKAKLEEGR